MYRDLPSVYFTIDRKGFVLVDGKRVLTQPGEHLRCQTKTLLTCQRCGRRAVAHSLRVVCEADDRIGQRYFHALTNEPARDLCTDCTDCIESARATEAK